MRAIRRRGPLAAIKYFEIDYRTAKATSGFELGMRSGDPPDHASLQDGRAPVPYLLEEAAGASWYYSASTWNVEEAHVMDFNQHTSLVRKLAVAAIMEKGVRLTPTDFALALKDDRIGALLDFGEDDASLFVVYGGRLVLTATFPEDGDGDVKTYVPGPWEESLFAVGGQRLSADDRARWARTRMN